MEEIKEIQDAVLEDTVKGEVVEQTQKELSKPISEEEFEKQIHQAAIANHQKVIEDLKEGVLHLRHYDGVKKFKSVRRAIKRGHMSLYGDVYPNKPYKNVKAVKGSVTYKKRRLYEQFTHKNRKVA